MLFKGVLDRYQRFRNRAAWERTWRRPGRPPWQADTPRPFVLAGFDAGWLAPGMTVLEIGCGHGNTANWLARNGLKVLAVDVSKTAIQKARSTAPETAGLAYEVADICAPISFQRTFDVILDTGCLQHLPSNLHAPYRENLLRASHAGSRFIATMHTLKLSFEDRKRQVQSLFTPPFELAFTEQVPPADTKAYCHLNSVFHFIRQSAK